MRSLMTNQSTSLMYASDKKQLLEIRAQPNLQYLRWAKNSLLYFNGTVELVQFVLSDDCAAAVRY
jgi:hypothetical protein